MIHIVDQIMGSGKTQAAINYINNNNNKYIYITPYLTEVDRIQEQCSFQSPVKYTSNTPKIIDFKRLLNQGKSIVTTHALFSYFDDEIIDLCYSQGYVLFLDEVADVVEPYNMTQADLNTMLDRYVDIQDNGLLKWRDESVNTEKYAVERRLCNMQCLAVYSGCALIWNFPIKIFKAFRESYILTYMFDAQIQKYYYDFYGLEYDYMHVEGDSLSTYSFANGPAVNEHSSLKDLVMILDDKKLNSIGDMDTALSKTWYVRNQNNILIKHLKDNVYTFFNNRKVLYDDGRYTQSSAAYNIWTTFTDFKKQLQGKGYTKGFIPLNMRATNEYRDRTVVAYLVNRYFNPVVKNFFSSNNIEVDEERFALSEMLQFIWRSGIRDGKKITLYVPSLRMRTLLTKWLTI